LFGDWQKTPRRGAGLTIGGFYLLKSLRVGPICNIIDKSLCPIRSERVLSLQTPDIFGGGIRGKKTLFSNFKNCRENKVSKILKSRG